MKSTLISLLLFATGIASLAYLLLIYEPLAVVGVIWGFGFLKLKHGYETR